MRALERFIACYGIPEQVQTDNGVEFTNRYTSRRRVQSGHGTYALFEQFLNSHGIAHRLIKVRTPEHNGKVERFNATLKRHLQLVARNGMTLAEFQQIVDDFLQWYNKRRPHWSLDGLTPHEKFYGPKLAKSAGGVRFLPGLDIFDFWEKSAVMEGGEEKMRGSNVKT